MNIEVKGILDRFKNLLEVKRQLYLEEISTTFTKRDIRDLIWVLGDYIAITAEKREV